MSAPAFERLHPAIRFQIVNHYQWPGLRPVQQMAVAPILDGHNVVVLAPTAGGKTEAAFFPTLSRMLFEDWTGLSVLYLSPIRALLNNQRDRLEVLTGLLGRRAATWHGDVPSSAKRRLRDEPPDVLLTTPESLEAMLVSTVTSSRAMFANVRAVIIDEVHAFAGDDRGWHLLGVLDRISRYAEHDLQRIGLSATVGNRTEIVDWLSAGSVRPRSTVDPPRPAGAPEPHIVVDHVGTLENAAKVIAALHPGAKRLVFCDSRKQAEELTRLLRMLGVATYVTHSSLSADQRALTERAFTEATDAVIVATSALELGIDIGDLDHVLQIDAPWSVASFLQRMGRTGRRAGTVANCTMLCITDDGLLRAVALIDAYKRGEVEPARAARVPYHVLAQQMLALTLERPGLPAVDVRDRTVAVREGGGIDDAEADALLSHLLDAALLFEDGGRLGMGREGERELGRRHFMELLSVFTTPALFTVMQGPREIGQVSAATFDPADDVQQVLLLAGRTWRVGTIDWSRSVAYVEPFDAPGRVRFVGSGAGMSAMLAEAHRRVALGSDVGEEHWSKRATDWMESLRAQHAFVEPDATVVLRGVRELHVWTFAGTRANRLLATWLRELGLEASASDLAVRVATTVLPADEHGVPVDDGFVALQAAWASMREAVPALPELDAEDRLLRGLKFARLLPAWLATQAVVARSYDEAGARAVVEGAWVWTSDDAQ